MGLILVLALLLAAPLAAQYRVGVARVDITPEGPIWLSGYGSRNKPSDGVLAKLWAKAVAIEDSRGGRVVIVTADLIAVTRAITDVVAARLAKEYDLPRAAVLFNASHTHTGPVVAANRPMFDLSATDLERVQKFTARLTGALFDVAGAALGKLAPARIEYGTGRVGFAVNRREPTPQGVRIGVNPQGPVDHTVPVIRIVTAAGEPLAILFGYACHNTTFDGNEYRIAGDYAGFAAEEIEKSHPGSTAMFVMLGGADQNPRPRGSEAYAREHGKTLAAEVERVLGGKLQPASGRIATAFEQTQLAFAPQPREVYEAELKDRNPARARRAKAILQALDERRAVDKVPYPVQAIRFGNGLTILALGGELVVEYALRAKRDFPGDLVVAGYSNDVMCYIPSARVLKEGGYEAVDSMVYYGQPGPFATDVETRVFDAIRRVLRRVGLPPSENR